MIKGIQICPEITNLVRLKPLKPLSMFPENDPGHVDLQSEHQKALLTISFTYYYLVDKMNDMFKRYGITRQQHHVLSILQQHYPEHCPVHFIKGRMPDKMSDTSRIVERLRLKGLVSRRVSTRDKRLVEVTITQPGLEQLARMEPDVRALDNLLDPLSVGEAHDLNTLLDKIRAKNVPSDGYSVPVAEQYRNPEEKITTLASA